jgi:hypothetical protein
MGKKRILSELVPAGIDDGAYAAVLADVTDLLESARRAAARSINSLMTATYWAVGRRIVEEEQRGKQRADYGKQLIIRLAKDLTRRCGRGFGYRNLYQMRQFYMLYPRILQTPSAKSEQSSPRGRPAGTEVMLRDIGTRLPLSWSHYVRLLSVEKPQARAFYEAEALRGGWTVRQLDRQIGSQFYERTLLSRNKAAKLRKGQITRPEDVLTPEEEIKDPFVLEFLDLKDEYSESDLEDENPPVGLILCAEHGAGVARYALEGLPNKILAAHYRTTLPSEETLVAELERTRKRLEGRGAAMARTRKSRR